MSGIEVLSRTQRIIVLPNTSVSIVKEGPTGPRGDVGPRGPQGLAGLDGESFDVEQHTPDYVWTRGEQGILALAVRQDADESFVDDDGDYTMLQIDADGKLKVVGPLTDAELRATPVPVTGVLTDTQLRASSVPVALDSTTLAALETIQIGSLPAVALDSATLAALENTTVTIDAASLASLETINVANIAGTEFAEDSPHTNGDAGSLLFAVRRDADTSSVSTDGDYAALLVDSVGRLKIKNVKDNQIVNGTVAIASGASITSTGGDTNNGIIDLRAKSLVGIQMPGTWTAAALTFSASMDGGTTFNDLYDDTMTERSISVVASRTITLDPTKFMGVTHLKLRSGTGASAVNQGAARTINYTTIGL